MADINTTKELAKAQQPLLLAVVTFSDASVLRLSTHPLSTSEGGYAYGGNNYVGRILSFNLGAFQGYDATGIDIIPTASVTIADADKSIKINYEDSKGFAGASLDLTFIFWDADTASFSSDSILKFSGVCDAAEVDFETLIVNASNLLNLQRKQLPNILIQRRCPWLNPVTVAQRATASDPDSPFYRCGETRSLAAAPACSFTKATCTQLLRFGGVGWDSPTGSYSSRDYVSGRVEITNAPNDLRYGEPVPMVYGTAWVAPKITNVFGDGNSTRGEAVVCSGEVNAILRVVVNDTELPPATDITGGTNYIVRDALLRYNVINRGDRDGSPNADVPWDGQGDPYGSMCAILWVVPRRAAEASTRPRMRVLVQGPKIRVYTDAVTYSDAYTDNPAWVLMDLLVEAGRSYSDLDVQSFIDAAAICSASVSYTDQYGSTSTHSRYAVSLVIDKRRSAAEIIRGVRMGCGGILVPNSDTGKIQLFIEGTLASQQPTTISGSNASSPVTSKSLSGSTVNGYYAYSFTRVLLQSGKSTLSVKPRPVSSTPNRVQFKFFNSERDYAEDSVSLLDPDAVFRAGGENTETLSAEGVSTLDQAKRVASRRRRRNLYANVRGDAGGTEIFEWLDTFRTIRLRVGQICVFTDPHYGYADVPVRITQIRPSSNFETVKMVAERHNDNHFLDSEGQNGDVALTQIARDRLARPSFPWGPLGAQPPASDPMYQTNDWSFAIRETSETMADGSAVTKLEVSGLQPVNLFSNIGPPQVGRQGTTSGASGTFPGGGWTYYAAVASKDSDGKLSALSLLCQTTITNAGSVNNITIPIQGWPTGAVGYVVYVGNTPQLMTKHGESATTPSSVTVTSWKERHAGAPDPEFDRMRLKMKRVAHSGVWGQAIVAVAANTLQVAGGMTVNQYAGYECSLLGVAAGGYMPIVNFTVSSNTATTLTVSPNPVTYGILAGDALIMRSTPTVGADYVEDALWANSVSGSGLTTNAEVGRILRIISGEGKGDSYRIRSNTATRIYIEGEWRIAPDSGSRYIIEEPDWQVIQTSDSLNNSDQSAEFLSTLEVANYQRQTLLVQGVTLDGGGAEALDNLCPIREIYVYGQPLNSAIAASDGYATMTITTGAVTPDLNDGLNQKVTLTANLIVNAPINSGGTIDAGVYLNLKFIQDATGGWSVTWNAIYKGMANEQPSPNPSTYSKFQTTFDGTDWELDFSKTDLS